jgi:hypothetical protein
MVECRIKNPRNYDKYENLKTAINIPTMLFDIAGKAAFSVQSGVNQFWFPYG